MMTEDERLRIEQLEIAVAELKRDLAVVPARVPVPPSFDTPRVIVLPNETGTGVLLTDTSEQVLVREVTRPAAYDGKLVVGPLLTMRTWWPMVNGRYQTAMYAKDPPPLEGDEIESAVVFPVFFINGAATVYHDQMFTFTTTVAQMLFQSHGKSSCTPTPRSSI